MRDAARPSIDGFLDMMEMQEDMRAPSENGTRYLGMSPRGGIASPHAANRAIAAYAVNAFLEDQHRT